MQFFRNLTPKRRKRSLRFFTRVSLILGVCLFFLGPQQIAFAQASVSVTAVSLQTVLGTHTTLQGRAPIVPAGQSTYNITFSSSITITENNSTVVFTPSSGSAETLSSTWSGSGSQYSVTFTMASGKTGTMDLTIILKYTSGGQAGTISHSVLTTGVDTVAPTVQGVSGFPRQRRKILLT